MLLQMMMDWDSHTNVEYNGLDIVCNIYINISSKGQHKGKELKCFQSKSVILMMRLNYSYMDRLYAQWGQCGVFMGIRTIQHLFQLFALSKCKLHSNWIDRNCDVLPLSLDDLLNYTTLMLKFCTNKHIWALLLRQVCF
jgi:hypothetical protein